jgi:hypothetical protein
LTLLPTILLIKLIILHILISRSSFPVISQQGLIIKITLILNLAILINYISYFDMNQFVFNIISFNCLAYSYFHFFNLSDTGRRIKILIMIYEKKNINNYSSKEMIENRLIRLQKFGWIKKNRNNYEISKNYPLLIFKILKKLRNIS